MQKMYTPVENLENNNRPVSELGEGLLVNDGQAVGVEYSQEDFKKIWEDFCVRILPHLEAIHTVVKETGIDPCIRVGTAESCVYAFYVSEKEHYNLDKHLDGNYTVSFHNEGMDDQIIGTYRQEEGEYTYEPQEE